MMKKSIFKKAIASSMLLGLLTVSSSYAAAPVAQQAYYDTFSFKVNGATNCGTTIPWNTTQQ